MRAACPSALPCCSPRIVPHCCPRVAPCSPHVAPCCSLRDAPCCPAQHAQPCRSPRPAALQPVHRAALPLGPCTALPCSPARRALLPCPARALLPCASRPAAARASHPAAPHRARAVGGGFGFMYTGQQRQRLQQETFSPQRLHNCVSEQRVPGCVEAAALGASESALALGASESAAALGASESATALAATASTATGPASGKALHTFTLDSGASLCFFRDCTTVTPLTAHVPVSLADPSGGPLVARASTVLPCPAAPSGSLAGLHLSLFIANLVSNNVLQDQFVTMTTPGGELVAICTDSCTGTHLAMFTRRPGSGLYTLTTASSQVAASGPVAASSQVVVSGPVTASGQIAVSSSCRVLTHQTQLWHHRLGHPSQ
ncbi:unnamed protein product [Closterium sp. NIES-54]